MLTIECTGASATSTTISTSASSNAANAITNATASAYLNDAPHLSKRKVCSFDDVLLLLVSVIVTDLHPLALQAPSPSTLRVPLCGS